VGGVNQKPTFVPQVIIMKVTVFGIGYVGLVQGAVLAEIGHDVICVDVDEQKVKNLEQGIIPIYEPGLEVLVKENYTAGRLKFTTDAASAVKHGKVQFIAVGTPPDEDGSADLKYVLAVAETIANNIESNCIIINKSTVPVGTADKVRDRVASVLSQRGRTDLSFDVASNPEFLKEGSAVSDCMRPDRIIIGTEQASTEEVIRDLYAPFNRNHEKIIVMDVRSAELTKYAANCMLATKISFMNEISNLSEMLGADIEMVRKGIGSDPRIGYHFIYAGSGYGGSCFPKDVQALIKTSEQLDFDAVILKSVEARNNEQKSVIFKKIINHYNGDIAGKTFALWGLSFKPNTDDMREAPSRVLMEALWKNGAKVRAYDPEAMEETQRIYNNRDDLSLCGTKEETLKESDALIIITEWQAFKAPDLDQIASQLSEPIIFDGRNLFDPQKLKDKGIKYYSIGRQ
jgi:UDPglucose 6-dehydrogenase